MKFEESFRKQQGPINLPAYFLIKRSELQKGVIMRFNTLAFLCAAKVLFDLSVYRCLWEH